MICASNPGGDNIFLTSPDRGCGVDNPPASSVEVKEIVEPYLYSPLGLMACFRATFTLTLIFVVLTFYINIFYIYYDFRLCKIHQRFTDSL